MSIYTRLNIYPQIVEMFKYLFPYCCGNAVNVYHLFVEMLTEKNVHLISWGNGIYFKYPVDKYLKYLT